ncbi:hypothetical protein [Clostridium beijerinckii]|uniref:ABC-type transport system involved in multi-copper enzyme maturation permease subunit n=1 Tax=Clostridium beijerinckii TaxID=1520 RepID=A0AAE5H8K5_CLOBE|nr:hypothetical protein [Clostridium beijerinckii]NSB15962.1 ABC-type transport system involved in multi-copper enzyme maturation permease subunit [Clostridium beijerinckii]OOM33290.1 ABC-2 family transporter protein [Clostridium beijerinckii]
MNYFKNELRRALISRNAVIAFVITLLSLLIAFFQFVQFPRHSINSFNNVFDAVDIFIRIRTSTQASILILIAPLLATVVFSDSYLLEKESGFLKFIYLRISNRRYVWTKIIVNGLSSGLVISIASLIILIFLSSIYGIRDTGLNDVYGPFSWIYYTNKLCYAIFLIFISLIFNVIFATLALGISPWIKNRYLTFLFPFFYYIASGTIFTMLGFNSFFSLNCTILFDLILKVSESNVVIYQCILLLVGILLFYFGVIKKNEKNI